MISFIFKALSFYWLFRALTKGPRGIVMYGVRRTLRRAVNRQIRKIG